MEHDFRTYEQGRCCKHCEEPIPDQAHEARDFCEREVLPDGSIKNCKDDYYIELRQKHDPPYRALVATQKEMTKAIERLLTKEGPIVSLEQVNRCGIMLPCAVETCLQYEWPRFKFIHHTLELLSMETIKIHQHEQLLL